MYFKIYGTGWSWLPRPTQGASPAASLDGRWPRNVGGEATHKPPHSPLLTQQQHLANLREIPVRQTDQLWYAHISCVWWCRCMLWDEIHCLNNTKYLLMYQIKSCTTMSIFQNASICFAKLSLVSIHLIDHYYESQMFWNHQSDIARSIIGCKYMW